VVVSVSVKFDFQPDLQMVAERAAEDVSPFDEHDAVRFEQFAKCQVSDFEQAIEAVEIGVVELDPASVVGVHECERRAGDRFRDAECPAESLGKCGLTCTHLAGEDDQVAGSGDTCDSGSDGMRGGE